MPYSVLGIFWPCGDEGSVPFFVTCKLMMKNSTPSQTNSPFNYFYLAGVKNRYILKGHGYLGSSCWHYQIQVLYTGIHTALQEWRPIVKQYTQHPFVDLKMSFNDACMKYPINLCSSCFVHSFLLLLFILCAVCTSVKRFSYGKIVNQKFIINTFM